MRSIQYFKDGVVKLVDIPEPEIVNDDDVKIKIAYCGVCGSDLHFKRAELDFLVGDEGYPMGHEATGVVVELGPNATAKGLKVGDEVCYYFNTHCGSCYYCRNGQEQYCSSMEINMSAMSDFIVVREQCVHKLNGIDLHRAALIEPISVCLHGVDMIGIKPGQTVAISGGGLMGGIITL
ncbi:MAG TPA: alcohol dehydrogenase catalytic domain-containing protein, partial [Clostridiaceae bacterium]|nr:alcohol dehydrogenase catalytic domain-containing protein [Clostridiaceae bacterium]